MFYRTLVLEDDENVRRILAMFLTKRGHKVVSFDSPLHCPNLDWSTCRCSRNRPCFDFLISDNMMPGMTGVEFLELQTQRGCHLDSSRKALITGGLREEEQEVASRLKCRIFKKPINWSEFKNWLEQGEAQYQLPVN